MTGAVPNPLTTLLPHAASCSYSESPPENPEKILQGYRNLKSMTAARRLEYAHGRYCAHQALSQLGLAAAPVPTGTHREPIWPDNFVGSISHCQNIAAAVAASAERLQGIGIDIETSAKLDADIVTMICRPEELEWLKTAGQPDWMSKLIFSAKEAAYKALWPLSRQYLDFQDLTIKVRQKDTAFTAASNTPVLPENLAIKLQGRFSVTGTHIYCAAWLID